MHCTPGKKNCERLLGDINTPPSEDNCPPLDVN